MMKDGGLGFRTANIKDGAIHEIVEYNFPWLELATRNQDGCSSPSCKNLNLIQTLSWRHCCSCAHIKNYRIVPRMDNY
jgi:hypothetical protein